MLVRPPFPINEVKRQSLVDRYSCLEHSEEDLILNQIVGIAAQYFTAPIALVSIVDGHRQWFKAGIGLGVKGTSRDVSFCAHSLHSPQMLQVCDASADPRFCDNALVTGSPGIRYYAGVPLVTDDGLTLGSLCVIDTSPRLPMSARDEAMLKSFAQLALARLKNLREVAFIDAPTGLFNRLRLEEDVAARIKREERLLVIAAETVPATALDGLVKALGFSFAADFAVKAKELFQQLLPQGCELYKISPLRFAFIITQGHIAGAERLFERLLAAFSVPIECRGVPVLPQLSIGVLPIESDEELDPEWMRLVVSASDGARENGPGWKYYDSSIDKLQQRSTLLLNALAEAIQAPDQLRLVYQPRMDLSANRCLSAEALIRWTHPILGEISPAEFIPLAEATASIRQLTLWVLERAIQQTVAWQNAGINLKVSVNISAADLVDDCLYQALTALLRQYEFDGTNLELEFTESALVKDFTTVRGQLKRLSALGVSIAIDDFGSGYSNWSYLREIPASIVKLDRSFMGNLLPGQTDWSIVRGLLSIARELNLRIVAEGVETELVYHLMRGWGCHEVQGYFIARPMPAAALAAWMIERNTPTQVTPPRSSVVTRR
jgi:EAL domain-containing protein (putative c-di-GMP-specific phosphodiesterase class I)/GGDEF domain-containing protein